MFTNGVQKNLSTALFLKGYQCPKALWLYKHRSHIRVAVSTEKADLLETVLKVSEQARMLFPGGINITKKATSLSHRLHLTHSLLQARDSVVLYEAIFQVDSLIMMADIIVKTERGLALYTIKNGTKLKGHHIIDMAFQYYVLATLGYHIHKASLIHLNAKYTRKKRLDVKKLLKKRFILTKIKAHQHNIHQQIAKIKQSMQCKRMPAIDIGMQCFKPYLCDYKNFCWKHLPQPSVFDISGLNKKTKFSLYKQGIVTFSDVKQQHPLTEKQDIQVSAELLNKAHIDKKGLRDFLSTLYYPLCFLDFEAVQFAIPRFEGSQPYQQLPFQFSLHYYKGENQPLEYRSFLAKPDQDPRKAFVKALLNAMPFSNPCILAFSPDYEKQTIAYLANYFPTFRERLMTIRYCFIDLLIPFKKLYLYTKEMKGRLSIKTILPALVPSHDYKQLSISNGEQAARYYGHIPYMINKEEVEHIKGQLCQYSHLDTFAMVKIVEQLRHWSRE